MSVRLGAKSRGTLRGSFENALERNKTEVRILRSNQANLDQLLHSKIAKLEREESNLSQQYVYMIKRQQADKHDMDMKAELKNHRKQPVSSRYFEIINLKKVDKGNWLLPSLVKSLNEQRLNSYRTLADICTRENIQLVRKSHPGGKTPHSAHTTVASAHSGPSRPLSSSTAAAAADLNSTSFSNFSVDSFYLPNLNRPATTRAKSAVSTSKIVDERPEASIYDINRFDLREVKSIRRERLSAREMNELYDSKASMIKISKQFDITASLCSKNCKFKYFPQ
jgi:hypothetical protein